MKHTLVLSCRFRAAALVTLCCCCLLDGGAASAQNLLGNPAFESPLAVGATNWTVVYVQGGPNDFEIKDRTTVADRNQDGIANTRGAHLRARTNKDAHAYFTQTVTNLVPGHSYTVEGDVRWHGGTANGFDNAAITYRVYFDALGGQAPARSPDVPDDGIDGWLHYSLSQTPDANGKIEVRLHLEKFRFCTYDKMTMINAYFDNFSVTY
jgi:hypothetical protein